MWGEGGSGGSEVGARTAGRRLARSWHAAELSCTAERVVSGVQERRWRAAEKPLANRRCAAATCRARVLLAAPLRCT